MRTLLGMCLLVLCSACQGPLSAKARTQQLVQQELQAIDWNAVDQYPLFENCDETLPKEELRHCFENTLLDHFSKTLGQFEYKLSTQVVDTLYLDFLIDNKGQIQMLDLEKNWAIMEELPEFEGIIARSLKDLPPLEPALKRGIPVTAKFRIPIIINNK